MSIPLVWFIICQFYEICRILTLLREKSKIWHYLKYRKEAY